MFLIIFPANGFGEEAGGPSIVGSVKIYDAKGKAKDRHDGVVVFLDGIENVPGPMGSNSHAVMKQVKKRFDPQILPIRVGTTVDFPNKDTVFHNVFSLSRNKPFDLGIYKQGESKSVTFDQTGLVKIYCNIHSQMVGYILVLANPYFTVTDQDGRFVISNVPVGTVKIRAWYSRSREHPEKEIKVTQEGIKNLDLSLAESVHLEIEEQAISIEHKNKLGKNYPAKY